MAISSKSVECTRQTTGLLQLTRSLYRSINRSSVYGCNGGQQPTGMFDALAAVQASNETEVM